MKLLLKFVAGEKNVRQVAAHSLVHRQGWRRHGSSAFCGARARTVNDSGGLQQWTAGLQLTWRKIRQ